MSILLWNVIPGLSRNLPVFYDQVKLTNLICFSHSRVRNVVKATVNFLKVSPENIISLKVSTSILNLSFL
ncbi:hypothetical protein B6I21_00535 [candidate division KSB1 bacterium 4572_119]|nr:MAG: hypothetical protein B6I21_00535 [candidate division KSB1 bacterium 4572_119]